MKFIASLALVPLICLAATAFTKAELDAHKAWMDDAQDKKDDVRDALKAKDAPKLIDAAKDIEKATALEEQFWSRTPIEQASRIAAENRGEAKDMLQFARAGKFTEAADAFARLEKTCSSCHDAHFEKQLATKP